jgi:CP family cyanate transporter-like MFS transporter
LFHPFALAGGWRGALIALSVAACVVAVSWTALERGGLAHLRPEALVPRLPWRSGTAWLLVSIFALMGCAYYGLNAWLPDAYVEHGWSDSSAGLLLAAMTFTAIVSSLAGPWLSDRHGGRLLWLLGMSALFAIGGVGLVAMPEAGYLWALVAGLAQGSTFALVMTLPLELERGPERVAALVAMMLGVGYSISAISPFVLGGIRDVTGSFDAVLWICAGLLTVMIGVVEVLRRRVRYAFGG